jgi:hypothetical protein
MLRHLTAILLPVALCVMVPAPAGAQARVPERGRATYAGLEGRYIFDGNGGTCFISRRGQDYLFVNERGARATFALVGPRRLDLVLGDEGWEPNMTATVTLDGYGRRIILFHAPNGSAGRWIEDR